MYTQDMLTQNIRDAITEKGLKQKYVADKAGFTEADFSSMMCGRKTIRAEYVPIIAEAIGIDINRLFHRA